MAFIEAGQTTHFIVQFDDSIAAHADARAQAVLATCESDLQSLSKYLPYHRGLGEDPFKIHQILVQLVDLVANRGGADNTGFRVGHQSIVHISAISLAGYEISDDFARFLFVAEVAELLMQFYGWNPGSSQGEALSRILAEELYPSSAYDSRYGTAPWVNAWMNSNPRPDWITKNEAFDRNAVSYGCGILFINFLRSQLNYTMPDISYLSGGVTLADRYRNLTGSIDDGFAVFIQLLEKHFPSDKPQTLLTNNPFPLYDATQREVRLSIGNTLIRDLFWSKGVAHIAPSFNCPAQDYKYTIQHRSEQLQCEAVAVGFGIPEFKWRVNGELLLNRSGKATVNADFTIDNPNDPERPHHSTGPFTFQYDIADKFTYQSLSSELMLENLSYSGRYDLQVEADVTEHYGGSDITSDIRNTVMNASVVAYEQRYYDDRRRCFEIVSTRLKGFQRLQEEINLLKTLPDPPPPGVMQAMLHSAERIRELLLEVAQSDRQLAIEAARLVAGEIGVQPELFFPTMDTKSIDEN